MTKTVYHYYDYIGRVQLPEFFQSCKKCGQMIEDTKEKLEYHLKIEHPDITIKESS